MHQNLLPVLQGDFLRLRLVLAADSSLLHILSLNTAYEKLFIQVDDILVQQIWSSVVHVFLPTILGASSQLDSSGSV